MVAVEGVSVVAGSVGIVGSVLKFDAGVVSLGWNGNVGGLNGNGGAWNGNGGGC